MKIAYILPVNMKNYGYTKENFLQTHFSVDIAREVAKKNNEVTLHVFWDKKDIYTENNLTVYFYPLSLQKIFNSGFAEISLELLCKKFHKDTVIHFHEPTRLFYSLFALFKKNTMVVEHHGTGINNPFPYPSRFSIPFGILKRFFLSMYFQKAAFIIVHNQLAQENIRTYHVEDKKIILTPNGIELHKYTIIPKSQAKKILKLNNNVHLLFAGRIHKAKGIIELVSAFEQIKKSYKNTELVILGPLDDAQLEHLVKPYWKGFKNPEELQKWLSAADIFCLPSYSEPFGIVLLEALYYNLPIITTNIAGPREFVPEKNAIFIQPKNIPELVYAIEKMMDASYRKMKSKDGHELVATEYTWKHVCKTYIELYNSVILHKQN